MEIFAWRNFSLTLYSALAYPTAKLHFIIHYIYYIIKPQGCKWNFNLILKIYQVGRGLLTSRGCYGIIK